MKLKFKFSTTTMFLALITLAGFLLRLWSLSHFPPSLNWDEISHGYNAYSLLKTGRDEWGTAWPLIFRAFGDYKLPLYIYLTLPWVSVLGLTPLAVRITSVIAGTVAIPGIFLLTNQLLPTEFHLSFKNKTLKLTPALLAAAIFSLTPWHFFISRPALEANLGLTIFIYGLFFLLRGLKQNINYLPAAVLLGLTMHTYNSYRVLTPLVLVAFLIIYRPINKKSLPYLYLPTLIFLAGLSLVIYQTFMGSGFARYSQLSILTPNSIFQIGQSRLASDLPAILARLVYNRPVYFITQVISHYLSFFTPAFLYQTSGAQIQFAIPGMNLFTLPITILYFLGIFPLLTSLKSKSHLFLLAIFLLSPLPAAITAAPPQALRPTPMLIGATIISTLGVITALNFIRQSNLRIVFLGLTLITTLLAFSNYLNRYYKEYPEKYSSAWQYGYEQAVKYIQDHNTEYDHVFMTKRFGEPHLFYAFYASINPSVLQPGGDSIRFAKSDWFWTDRIGKVYFVNDWLIPDKKVAKTLPLESGGDISTKGSLLFTSYDHVPSNGTVIQTINFLDGQPAFVIVKLSS